MSFWLSRGLVLAAVVGLIALAAGCGGDDDVTEATTPDGEQHGQTAYLAAGCQACHGDNGEGTEVGPALVGHSEQQVIQQVRTPLDTMPSYSQTELSDDELDEIAEYIVALGPEEETHVEPVELSNVVATHHWMALSAIKAGNLGDAEHHVEHVIGSVKGSHREAMEEVLADLRAGDEHDAEHVIEEVLAGEAEPDLKLERLHLRLALSFAEGDDRKEAIHHLRHFLQGASGEQAQSARIAIADLQDGDLHGATHAVEGLLGQPSHGE